MTAAAESLRSGPDGLARNLAEATVRLVASGAGPSPGSPGRASSTLDSTATAPDRSRAAHDRTVRSWPLLILALPAAVAVWSGWVGIGQMTGFGQVHPLPGIWGSLHLNTAVTLPIGVEAYAAYALRAWLSTSNRVSARTRRFARWSAIGSLLLDMAGQVAYHLLTQSRAAHAPWGITTAVSCLPVLVLGMGAALAHLLRADAHDPADSSGAEHRVNGATLDHAAGVITTERLAQAVAVATRLCADGRRISRRTLRAGGIRGSNADLGTLASIITAQPSAKEPGSPPTAIVP